jgi:hypothetical protein
MGQEQLFLARNPRMTTPDSPILVVHTDPIAILVKNRAVYVPKGINVAEWMASGLVRDALALGCSDVSVLLCEGWILVGSRDNWLSRGTAEGLELASIFRHCLPLGTGPLTSHGPVRHEAFVMAYARDIMVLNGRLLYRIKGDELPKACVDVAKTWPFCVGYRVAEEQVNAAAVA